MRKLYSQNKCYHCGRYLTQPKIGRTRKYCSEACKQKSYRFKARQKEGRAKRHRKEKPHSVYEREFSKFPTVKKQINDRTVVYVCQACGKQVLRHHIHNRKASRFCSDACEQRSRAQWRRLIDAYYVADSTGRLSEIVDLRLSEGYLSPICPQCGIPFPYRAGRGRKRKYCSDACRRAAFEHRYEIRMRRKRKHRYGKCATCGTRFDRIGAHGKMNKRYCSLRCQEHACQRAYKERLRERELERRLKAER